MKQFVVALGLSLAVGVLFLTGCSKSKSAPASNKGIVTIITTTNPASPTASASHAGSSSNSKGGGAGPASAGPVDMKIKWRVGRQYNMQLDLDQPSDMNLDGRSIHTEMKMMQVFHYSPLKKLGNGAYQVQMEFDRHTLDLAINGTTLRIDTAKGASDDADNPVAPVAKGMCATLGAPLDFTIGADGTVEKVDGLDNFTNGIIMAVPDENKRGMLDELFNADTLKNYGDFSDTLPGHPVNVGDTWTSRKDISIPAGQITVSAAYTFKNWEYHNGRRSMHLLVRGDLKSKSKDSSRVATDGTIVKFRQGTSYGEAWFDPWLGAFVEIDSDYDMTLDLTVQQKTITEQSERSVQISLQDIR